MSRTDSLASGAEDLVGGVTDPQPQQDPMLAPVVEAFGAGQQQPADPIQRIILAAPMPHDFEPVILPVAERGW